MTEQPRSSRRRFRALPEAVFTTCAETPPQVLFHGTTKLFDHFSDMRLGKMSGHASAALGHFLSACPRIASSYALKPSILDRAHEVLAGSKVLLDPAWPMSQRSFCSDGMPYEPGGQIMLVSHSIQRAVSIEAIAFAELLDDDYAPEAWGALRHSLLDDGYQALLIEGDPDAMAARRLVSDLAPDTWVALTASIIEPIAACDWPHLRDCAADSFKGPTTRKQPAALPSP